jgi:hypothetical protein
MPRHCTICEHQERASIELGLANHTGVMALSRQHNVSKKALERHRANHMPAALKAELMTKGRMSPIDLENLRRTESEGILQNLVVQRARLYRNLDLAETSGDFGLAVRMHMALSRNIELTAKLLGDLKTGHQTVNNILVMPAYHQMRVALVKALQQFPDAKAAVIKVLQTIEGEVVPAIEMH